MRTAHLRSPFPGIALAVLLLTGCGDNGGSMDTGPGDVVDAMNARPDVVNGVVCSGAQATYGGTLLNPAAEDDGQELQFFGDLNANATPDRLRLLIADNAAQALGTFELPTSEWTVSICVDDGDESCTSALPAYSGSLRVDSITDRLQASLDRVIFVDDLDTPTCSASLSQASIDVAILGPP